MASNLEFIEKRTASDVISVTWTDLFTSKYNIYELYFDIQYNSLSYLDMYLLDSSGAVLTDSNHDVSVFEMKAWTTFHQYYYENSTLWRDLGAYLENTNVGGILKMTVFNPTSETYTQANAVSISKASSGLRGGQGQGIYTATNPVHGLKVQASGGGSTTFDFLNVSVFGVKE